MERRKTDAELKQEESDAAFARQMQEEMDRQDAERARAAAENSAPAQPAAPPQPLLEGDMLTVACPACTFLNEIRHPVRGKRYACEQCRTPLPTPDNLPDRKDASKHVECKICHSVNRVPNKKADAVLCGACYQQLGSSLEPAPAVAPPAATPSGELRTVQIRCGQCSAVNAVQVSADAKVVQFECGGCTTINEVTLSE